jgi:hypothetical protein
MRLPTNSKPTHPIGAASSILDDGPSVHSELATIIDEETDRLIRQSTNDGSLMRQAIPVTEIAAFRE